MRPTAILFDAGGTLVLQDPESLSSLLGIPIDPDAAFEAHYRTMAEFSTLKLAGTDHTWDWWLEQYFSRLGHPAPAEAGPAIRRGFGLWKWVIPGVGDTLKALRDKGVRIAVVSNSDGSVEGSLTEGGINHLFELTIDSEVVGVKKPDPAIFELTLDRMELEPHQTWYVGDSEFHDVGGAEAAGLAKAVLVDPFDLHREIPHRVAGLPDLVDLVR